MLTTAWQTTKSFAAALWTPLRVSQPPVICHDGLPPKASPAVVAWLTGHHPPWSATLADLAQRGIVHFEKEKSSTPRSTAFTLYRQADREQGLTPYESILLEAIFSEADDVALASVAPRLDWQAVMLEEALEGEMAASGWLDLARKHQREQRLAISVKSALVGVALLVGGLVIGAGVQATAPSSYGAGLAVMLAVCGTAGLMAGLLALGLGGAFSILSAQGELAAAQCKGFALFMKQTILGRQPPREPVDAYLPLAVALGLAKVLIRARPSPGQPPLPPWFGALAAIRRTGDWGAQLGLLTVAEAEPDET
jgi:hypothetical protein